MKYASFLGMKRRKMWMTEVPKLVKGKIAYDGRAIKGYHVFCPECRIWFSDDLEGKECPECRLKQRLGK